MNINDFKAVWIGKTFRCNKTGEHVTITEEQACPRSFVKVGEGFVDLGDGVYSRISGVTQVGYDDLIYSTWKKQLILKEHLLKCHTKDFVDELLRAFELDSVDTLKLLENTIKAVIEERENKQ